MKKLLILFVIFFVYFVSGCQDEKAPVTEPSTNYTPPSCVTSTKLPTIEFDYPYGGVWDTMNYLFSDGGAKFKSAFNRCGCGGNMIKPDMKGTQNPDVTIPGTSLEVLNYVVNTYKATYYSNLGTGYLLALSNAPEIASEAGITSNIWANNTSIIFTENLSIYQSNFFWLARSKTIIHEIGHMLGQLYDNEYQHSGRLADTCVMRQFHMSPTDPVCVYQQFCDHCACEVFDNTFNQKYTNKYYSNFINSNKKSNFEISIIPSKSEYLQLEPVWITIQIKNVGSSTDSIDIYRSLDLLPKFIITDMRGNTLPYHYVFIDYAIPNYIKLKNNEQSSFNVELSIGFGDNKLGENKPMKYTPISFFSKGKYSASLYYYNDSKKETVYSNITEFSVISPENVDLSVFKKLVEINSIYDVKFPVWSDFINDLKKLYENNQNCIYSEEVLFNRIYTACWLQSGQPSTEYRHLFNNELMEDCKTFFYKYPNSFYNEQLLTAVLSPYAKIMNKSKNDIDNFLNDLINKYPNTKIKDAAYKLINDDKYINKLFSTKRKGN